MTVMVRRIVDCDTCRKRFVQAGTACPDHMDDPTPLLIAIVVWPGRKTHGRRGPT
jgi:hypothetical protein